MLRMIYSLLMFLALPIMIVRLYLRSIKYPLYKQRIRERLGLASYKKVNNCVWLHAVSLGEARAATPLLKNLIAQKHIVLVTTTTPTGSKYIQEYFGTSVIHYYLPFDLNICMKKIFYYLQPKLLLVMETEIWPNLFATCKKNKVHLIIVNAFISEHSFKNYRQIKSLLAPTLSCITLVLAQSQEAAKRYKQIGLNPDKVKVLGNIKYDFALPTQQIEQGKKIKSQIFTNRFVFAAISTHNTEENFVLESFKKVKEKYPNVALIIVPRHPNRFNEVARLISTKGLLYERKSQVTKFSKESDVYLGDSIGEMYYYLSMSDVVFVGGSIAPIGGHNLIEPASIKKPVIAGPHLHKTRDIYKHLEKVHGLFIINNQKMLKAKWLFLLENKQAFSQMGENAYQAYMQNKGALAKILTLISKFL